MHEALDTASKELTIAGRTLRSRLLLGTGGFPSLAILGEAIAASGCEIVTVALRRVDPGARGSLIDVLADAGVSCFVRTRRGDEVSAACGQLAIAEDLVRKKRERDALREKT